MSESHSPTMVIDLSSELSEVPIESSKSIADIPLLSSEVPITPAQKAHAETVLAVLSKIKRTIDDVLKPQLFLSDWSYKRIVTECTKDKRAISSKANNLSHRNSLQHKTVPKRPYFKKSSRWAKSKDF